MCCIEEESMEGGRIRLQSEDGALELEILEETVVNGVNYILVTDAPEGGASQQSDSLAADCKGKRRCTAFLGAG